jgi:hypothetical protein
MTLTTHVYKSHSALEARKQIECHRQCKSIEGLLGGKFGTEVVTSTMSYSALIRSCLNKNKWFLDKLYMLYHLFENV